MPTIYLGHHSFLGRCYNRAPKSAAYHAGKKVLIFEYAKKIQIQQLLF